MTEGREATATSELVDAVASHYSSRARAYDALWAQVIAADRAQGMLARVSADVARVVADAQAPPFRARSFDVVVLAFVLFHVPNPARALTSARSRLRPDGGIGVTTWGQRSDAPALSVINEELARANARKPPRY